MSTVLLLLSLLAGAAGLAPPGAPPECLQGPEFWCQDMATAARCGQLQLCLAELSEGTEEQHPLVKCWVCRKVITKLKKLVRNPDNTSSVTQALKKICSTFPSVWAGQCHQVVDRFVLPIEEGLAQDLEPRAICASIHMCAGQDRPAHEGAPWGAA
ncbi:granulysin [Carettochelys insculpta]|uniref:granulysin n=1 Tax=Carettochelys insculpta TaxID=44489 RepID=UPI003EB92663